MSALDSDCRQRHEKLAKIVVQFRKIMQMILKENITPKGLKAKFTNKTLSVPLTDIEIALMEELPNINNFTVGLCYKILRLEKFIDEPKSKLPDTRETKSEIGYEINQIIDKRNNLIGHETNDITEEYYKKFTNEVKQIANRVDAYLAQGQIVYDMICRCMTTRPSNTCLEELKKMEPIHSIRIRSAKENCEQRDRISRIGVVIIEKFPCFLVDIITEYCQKNKRNPPGGDPNTLESGDVLYLYHLLKNRLQIRQPTNGWGKYPKAKDTTLTDDIERIRHFRNDFAHRKNEVIGKEEYEQYFSEFCEIGRRIDVYLGNRKRRNNSSISKCELEVLKCKTCPMDYNLKVKYENALKELENVKLQVQYKTIKLFYGDTFEKSLKRLRYRLKEEILSGTEKIRIQIILENVQDKSEAVRMLNVMRKEINRDLTDIDFIEASLGSIVLFVEISAEHLRTEPLLQSLIIQFMERLLSLNIMEMDPTEHIDAVLVSIEECSENKSVMSLPLVCLEFDVEANIFETDKKMQAKLCKTVTHLLDRSNVKRQEKDISATLLPLSEPEMDFSEEETLNSTTSRQRSLSDGTGDSLTLKTIHKEMDFSADESNNSTSSSQMSSSNGDSVSSKTVHNEKDVIIKTHGVTSDKKYKRMKTDMRADINLPIEMRPCPLKIA